MILGKTQKPHGMVEVARPLVLGPSSWYLVGLGLGTFWQVLHFLSSRFRP